MPRRKQRSISAQKREQLKKEQCNEDVSSQIECVDQSTTSTPKATGLVHQQSDITLFVPVVCASHDQGHFKYSEDSRGNQCTCNSVAFLAVANYSEQLQTHDLDRILDNGDALYNAVRADLERHNKFRDAHLEVSELPHEFVLGTTTYRLETNDAICGPLQRQHELPDLGKALRSLTGEHWSALLLTGGYSIAVMRDVRTQRYIIFDAHSRNINGLLSPDGTAVMLTFPDVDSLVARLYMLCNSLGFSDMSSYELTPVSITTIYDSQSSMLPSTQTSTPVPRIQVRKLSKCRRKKVKGRTGRSVKYKKTSLDIKIQRSMARKEKYRKDAEYRAKYIRYTRNYNAKSRAADKCFYLTMKRLANKHRYAQDESYRKKQKTYKTTRYAQDESFRQKQKLYVTRRYAQDESFRQKQKNYIRQRYISDSLFKVRHKQMCANHIRNRYRQCNLFRQRKNKKSIEQFHQKKRLLKNIDKAIANFRKHVQNGPSYICTVCHRTLFRNQVDLCKREKVGSINLKKCFTGTYVHKCTEACHDPCSFVETEHTKEWICKTCNKTLTVQKKMPCLAVVNKLELTPIPDELTGLNILERHVIAKFIPFAKLVNLPKGSQKGIQGCVVCVPSEVGNTVRSLPRCTNESQFLKVKLKRRLHYKGHYQFQTLSPTKVRNALKMLQQIHSEYGDVQIDENETVDVDLAENNLENNMTTEPMETNVNDNENEVMEQVVPENVNDNELENEVIEQEVSENVNGLALDTCLQPEDIGQEVMSYQDDAYCIAPAEGNKPTSCFKVPKIEAMAFPVQFPDGRNTFDQTDRLVKLSLSRYFNARLFNADNRFASDTNYIFFAQFTTELQMASSQISIELRKNKSKTRDGRNINSAMLKDKQEIRKLVKNNEIVRFMKPIRGTPAYWDATLRDLFAMLRQLGKPAFFATFSAAEMRWPEMLSAIVAQQGKIIDFDSLDWVQKMNILKSNPVTAMRVFEHRVNALITKLIKSPARPIGEVQDHFYRVEYQQRGSPHIHCLFWIKGAPELDKDSDLDVVEFVDQYVTCELPDAEKDPELYEIVTKVQTHSKNHSKTCKQNNKTCRYGFPKPPMNMTQILRTASNTESLPTDTSESDIEMLDEQAKKDNEEAQKIAKEKLQLVWNLLSDKDANFSTIDELLEKANLTNDDYLQCMKCITNSTVLHLKRRPQDSFVNGYNKHLLRAWNANMDIQYVLNPYCCVMYILTYISKGEKEMSTLLNSVIAEARESEGSDHDDMKKVMQAYSRNREVSAQEAVARVCSMKLKSTSREVIFIRTDDTGVRMSLPLHVIETKHPDSTDIWATGWPEKYEARPETAEFDLMCMAQFVSNYRRVQRSKSAIALQNGLGYIQKRTRGKPAVIRFAKFSQTQNTEKFYGTLLKLYLPFRSSSHLKSTKYDSYEEFYTHARVMLPGTTHLKLVSQIVDENRKMFEKYSDIIDAALEQVDRDGPFEDAWAALAPASEADRLESIIEQDEDHIDPIEQDNVPDLAVLAQQPTVPLINTVSQPVNVHKMYQKLNKEQTEVFYYVRDWCKQKVMDETTEAFHVFVSGGGGVGKSTLIRSIYTEATKLLCRRSALSEQTDISKPSVLLTAFTGTAAFNIDGSTLHRVFKLTSTCKGKIRSLSTEKLDPLIAALSNLEILVIDEISMVSPEILAYVDDRLKQVKGNRRKPFGNVSVLAVGDFYQLPPVKAKLMCTAECDIWHNNFKLVELTQIMRQKDDTEFAAMLNRLRTKTVKQPLTQEDKAILTSVSKPLEECPGDVLHIFPTNEQCTDHNVKMLQDNFENITVIPAEDYKQNTSVTKSGMVKQSKPVQDSDYALPDILQLSPGARVMIIRNVDVEDGLCNGTFGNISNIVKTTKNEQQYVTRIGIDLDNKKAGLKHRKNLQGAPDNTVYIERCEEALQQKRMKRKQFPLKLAYACTVHKVQGMTTSSAVVCLDKIFAAGQAYVALSRVTSLNGLHIVGLNESKIYSNALVSTALEAMPRLSCSHTLPLLNALPAVTEASFLSIVHHNTEGLVSHADDLKSHHELMLVHVLCLTETHLKGMQIPDTVQLQDFSLCTRNRLGDQSGGGVAAYIRNEIPHEQLELLLDNTDLEYLAVRLYEPQEAVIVTIYRPPQKSVPDFVAGLALLLDRLVTMKPSPLIVCGDFNEDQLRQTNKPILNLFQDKGFEQIIGAPTTEKNTLLDLVFVSCPRDVISRGVMRTYYSYHDPVFCILST